MLVVVAALGVDPQFGWAKRAHAGDEQPTIGRPETDAHSSSAIHIRRGVQTPPSAASRVRNAQSARKTPAAHVRTTQLNQQRGPDNVLSHEMSRVMDYVKKSDGHLVRPRRTKPHEKEARTKGRTNMGADWEHFYEARDTHLLSHRGGNDRSRGGNEKQVRILSPVHLRRRPEPAAILRSRGKPLADAHDASDEQGGASKRGSAHRRRPKAVDGGYQKSALKQKHAPKLQLNRPVRPEGRPAAEYDFATKTYSVPAEETVGPAAAPGAFSEQQLRSLGEEKLRAEERMQLLSEKTPPPAEAQPPPAEQKQKPPTAEPPAEQKPMPAAEQKPATAEAVPPLPAKLEPPGNSTGTFLEKRSPAAPAEQTPGAAKVPDEEKAEPAFGEHHHGANFQRVGEKLREDEKKELLGERGAGAMVSSSKGNASDASALGQGVHLSDGAAQKILTSELHTLQTSGELTQTSANDAVLNWLAASRSASAPAGAPDNNTRSETTFNVVKGATDMVATDKAVTPPSSTPWYKRFGPFDSSI